jgi:hypothetical protein
VSSDNILFATFYREVGAGIRTPEENAFDKARLAVDAMIFPYYSKDIHFAALSLDDRGPESYGAYSIVLKDMMIEERATVFEENTLVFCRRFGIKPGDMIPTGYRAKWADRHQVGIAKLQHMLTPSMNTADFPQLLLKQHASTDKGEFIEVHIYGSINRRAIEKIVGPRPASEEDKVIMASIESKLAPFGARLVVY